MQKVQRWSQPFCTWTKARARPSMPSIRWPAVSRTAHDVVDLHLVVERHAERHRRIASAFILSALPMTRSTSAMSAKSRGVGLRRAAGDDDLAARIVAPRLADRLLGLPHGLGRHRAGVDDQRVGQPGLLGLGLHHFGFVGVEAAAEGERLDAHQAASQLARPGAGRRIELAGELVLGRAGHQDMVVGAPFDDADRRPAASTVALRPRCAWCGRPLTSAAQAAVPQARVSPAPRSQVRTMMWSGDTTCAMRDVGALGEDRMVLEQRPEAVERVVPDVVLDPEGDVRIAHRDGRRRVQHRRVDRPDLQLDAGGVAEFLGQRDLVPAEARLAHVDGDESSVTRRRQQPARSEHDAWRRSRRAAPRRSACRCRRLRSQPSELRCA